jgi:hypothetical protein
MNFFSLINLGKFFIAFPIVIWWRSISINYDASPGIKIFVIRSLLKTLRALFVFLGLFLCFSFFSTLWLLYNYLDMIQEWSVMELLPFLISVTLSVALGIGYLYYWNITQKSMKKVA